MLYDFDNHPERRDVPGEKWGRYAGRDILPMWVADMDFPAPPPVLEALSARIQHGVFGYTHPWPSLIDAVITHIARDHDWHIDPDWLIWLPGVVSAFNLACRAVGEEGDGVFTASPVYPPFFSAPGNNARRLVQAPLTFDGTRWQWDRAATAAAIDARTRLFMLCNPHNPVGRVFDEDELRWIADLAAERELIICSDEIHCGLVLDPDKKHRPIAALAPEVARRTITLMAPSKVWNIPALYCAIAIIPDPGLRARFRHAMRGIVPEINVLGFVAAEAAYREGEPWRRELITYLRGNRDRVVEAVAAMPGLSTSPPEATYLAWIDCRAAGLEHPAEFFEAAGVGLSDGKAFGLPGFVRLNFGCARATLDEALARMTRALAKRG
ncbi:aspartate aminotransferase [Betaproteobacteria bacterium]|nr:aspartate aminotransferase [Betaproteobacteria bacterium]